MSELTLTKDNFDREVINSGKTAVVDFWAPWCGPCRMLGGTIESFARENEGRFVVGKVNVDDEDELTIRYNIMSIPSIKVFRNGQVIASAVGIQSARKLLEAIAAQSDEEPAMAASQYL